MPRRVECNEWALTTHHDLAAATKSEKTFTLMSSPCKHGDNVVGGKSEEEEEEETVKKLSEASDRTRQMDSSTTDPQGGVRME